LVQLCRITTRCESTSAGAVPGARLSALSTTSTLGFYGRGEYHRAGDPVSAPGPIKVAICDQVLRCRYRSTGRRSSIQVRIPWLTSTAAPLPDGRCTRTTVIRVPSLATRCDSALLQGNLVCGGDNPKGCLLSAGQGYTHAGDPAGHIQVIDWLVAYLKTGSVPVQPGLSPWGRESRGSAQKSSVAQEASVIT
jgi:hypothetical protein